MGILDMSNLNDEEVRSALLLIKSTKLLHPSGSLLESFVSSALYPELAARYVKKRLELGEASSLVDDWLYIVESIAKNGSAPPRPSVAERHAITRRDGGKCCVTGKAASLRDPLVVVPILPVPTGWDTEKAGITDMLGAFFGLSYRDWWLSYIRNPEGKSPCYNHWLVRRSTAKAFASGIVRLNRLHPSMVEYELEQVPIGPEEPIEVNGIRPLLGDHSRSGITKVDPRFVGSQARLSKSIQYLGLYERLSSETQPQPSCLSIDHPAQRSNITLQNRWNLLGLCMVAFFTVWRLVPSQVRIFCYKILLRLGERLYGSPDDYLSIQRLPFGLYLKLDVDDDFSRNEFNALEMVYRHTSIPVPKALDIVIDSSSSWTHRSYLLMKRDPGFPLSSCQDVLFEKDMERIANQLKDYIDQLRNIPRSTKSDKLICNTLGETCRDPRIHYADSIGSFADEAAFSRMLRFSDDSARRGHKIVFTHADLTSHNILINQSIQPDGSIGWDVTGIVNWEFAGYYPEYWEYTKAILGGRWAQRYNDIVHGVFRKVGDYSRELEVEQKSWQMLKG
ncbi:hypothetical protein F4813DRAFT_394895 [Daldinia decipiens]|uniref:uncharacterized protein n=1 Tax=Daldinia decipiens TaxID=326647 RepID=UPI0020C1BAA0|nr:uncharacterized protein F4813DRAFT_394895 [Daldinia decipiens]KAI1662751.1 hypothetical protein F4813DRAFT_394895 [Daldinia decipiens]